MEFEVKEQKKEPLLSRVKATANISFEKATPSYKEILPALASALKKDEKLIAIRNVKPYFGQRRAILTAYAYDDEGSKNLIEGKEKKKEDGKSENKEVKQSENQPDQKSEGDKV